MRNVSPFREKGAGEKGMWVHHKEELIGLNRANPCMKNLLRDYPYEKYINCFVSLRNHLPRLLYGTQWSNGRSLVRSQFAKLAIGIPDMTKAMEYIRSHNVRILKEADVVQGSERRWLGFCVAIIPTRDVTSLLSSEAQEKYGASIVCILGDLRKGEREREKRDLDLSTPAGTLQTRQTPAPTPLWEAAVAVPFVEDPNGYLIESIPYWATFWVTSSSAIKDFCTEHRKSGHAKWVHTSTWNVNDITSIAMTLGYYYTFIFHGTLFCPRQSAIRPVFQVTTALELHDTNSEAWPWLKAHFIESLQNSALPAP